MSDKQSPLAGAIATVGRLLATLGVFSFMRSCHNAKRRAETIATSTAPNRESTCVYSAGKGTDAFPAAVAKHLTHCITCAAAVNAAKVSGKRDDTHVERAAKRADTSEATERPLELMDHPQYAVEREIGRGGTNVLH